MFFKFRLKQKACCGGTNSTVLSSVNYTIFPENAQASIVKALDSFANNYREQPIEVVLTSDELRILQQQLAASEFTIVLNKLLFRRIPVSIKD